MRARLVSSVVALLALPACLDPIVGTQCVTGYSPCGGKCVATGSCAIRDAGEAADGEDATLLDGSPGEPMTSADVAVESSPIVDGQPATDADQNGGGDAGVGLVGGDAAIGDAPDAAGDGTVASLADGGAADDASVEDAGMSQADGSDADTGWDDTGPLQCSEPMAICNDQCVDWSSDPENCGGCNAMCTSGVCISGACLTCDSAETVCGRQCVNTASDPDNCGSCFAACASGLCSNSQCAASGTGRVIVIGHDYLKNRPAMNRILGNAVFLWPINPVRLLTYQGAANPAAIAGAVGAITQVATATGRLVQPTDVAAAEVPTQLAATDVFLIYGQEQASDATLNQLGQDWTSAIATFVSGGGTVILLDAFYSANAGGVQILSQAGLFNIRHNVSTTNDVCTVVSPGDALASGLPRTYRCEENSVSFTTTEVGPAVTSVVESGTPVVIDKVFF